MIIGAASVCGLTTDGALAVGCGGVAVPNKVGAARPLGISRSADRYTIASKPAEEYAPAGHRHKQNPALS